MKICTIALAALFVTLVALKISAAVRRRHLKFISCSLGRNDDEKKKFSEILKKDMETHSVETEEEFMDAFGGLDPEEMNFGATNVVIYDEENNVVIVSYYIMARIVSGDADLSRQILDYMHSLPKHPDLVVAEIRSGNDAA